MRCDVGNIWRAGIMNYPASSIGRCNMSLRLESPLGRSQVSARSDDRRFAVALSVEEFIFSHLVRANDADLDFVWEWVVV